MKKQAYQFDMINNRLFFCHALTIWYDRW